jgi:hypothetical protein
MINKYNIVFGNFTSEQTMVYGYPTMKKLDL